MSGIFFIMASNQHIADHPGRDFPDLKRNYGRLDHIIYALFQSVTGGVDWGEPAGVLAEVHSGYRWLYALFIAFTQFAVLNVVTGIFVEQARQCASNDLQVMIQAEAS